MTNENEALQRRIETLERALQSQRREMLHRVRNLLAMVRSVARRTGEINGGGETGFHLLDGRLAAFGRVQSVILRDEADLIELGALIADELLAHGVRIDHLALPQQPVRIKAGLAVLLVLVWHELVTFSEIAEPIDVEWHGGDADNLIITWRSMALAEDHRPDPGFLAEMLERALPYETGASATLLMDGELRCTIAIDAQMAVIGQAPEATPDRAASGPA